MQLKVTPIYGSSTPSSSTTSQTDENSESLEWLSSPGPSCTLVEYAGMKVLLNAGWDETLSATGNTQDGTFADNNNMPILPKELPNVDAVLICDSTLSSLGGLPLYFGASKTDKFGRAPRSLHHENHANNNEQPTTTKTNPPFLATYPTVKMGQMTLYDHHASLSLDGCNPGYSLEDVDAVFGKDSFHTLKYSQTVYLPLDEDEYSYNSTTTTTTTKKTKVNSNKTNKLLAITPYLSGHVVGGCFWVLKQLSDDTEVVLAPTYHHAKEKHLPGSTLHKFGLNADALLTMPGGPRGLLGKLYQPPPKKDATNKEQQQQIVHYNRGKPILTPPMGHRSESELIEFIMQALRRDGNVLLPVDASGRVLELLLVLDRHWERQRLGAAYNLCWVGPMSINTIEFARAQLEWMNPPLGAQFDSQRGLNPYRLKNIKICSSMSELESVIEKSNGNPTAVLASGASLDHGPARDLLLKWGDNPDNLVLLTNSSRCVPRGDVWSQRIREKISGVVKEKPGLVVEDVAAVAAAAGGAGGEADDEGKLVGAALAPSDVSSYTAASQLLYKWCVAKASGEEMADEVGVDTYVPHRAPLAGGELKAFLAAEEEERRMKKAEAEKKAMMQEIELARGQLRLGEDAEGGSGGVEASSKGASGAPISTAGAGATSPKRPRKKSRFNQDLFIKFSKPVHMTFDVREEAVGLGQPDAVAKYGIGESISRLGDVVEDDYGISVKAESFVDIVTGVDPSKFSGGTGRIGEEVTRRGLGFGVDGKQVVTSSGGGDADNLLNDADDEGMNEKMLEIADLSSGKGIIRGRNGRQPIKVSVIPRRLEVLAEVVYVPLEGRVDARAARQQVRALQPRHLVIIGGSKSNSLLLGDALRSSGPSYASEDNNAVHIPVDGETIQLTVGHAAYPVRLLDTPYLTQSEKEAMEVEEKEIEPVEPFEAKIGECTVSLVDFVATGKKWAVDGSLVLAPRRQGSSLNQPSLMLSAREVLLTDLRSEVIALGMKAEYSALSGYSQLIINGKIFVRKDTASGKLGVEGPLCEDFFRVRSLVSSQFVTL